MKNTMNYEAPVAEMIELQASMVLMGSNNFDPNVHTPSTYEYPEEF